ncbi:M23 family metallopeptidase [Agromyces humi]|uniref:M23 family metallopeptidase n=1 Tax=Agromyces humi TaxID=1766800 RepID=UPI001F2E1C8C|nr:M23 family metallopeptidase [Agromyces humi]
MSESPTWTQVRAVKAQPEVKELQVSVLERTVAELSAKAEQVRAEATAATAAFVDAVYELPDVSARDTITAPTVEPLQPIVALGAGLANPVPAPATASTDDTTDEPTPDTPEARVELAATTQAAVEGELAQTELKVAETLAQIRYLTGPLEDVEPFQASVDAVAKRVAAEAETRLQEQTARKQAEETARLAAIEEARWANPGTGRISDVFGPRPVICSDGGCSSPFHGGTDVATGCDAPIFAARRGTVVYAGYDGTHGNFVLIDHGDGIQTGYAHITVGGIFVGVGQWVGTGQHIANSGTTGASDGCHLHFEVYENGNQVDPQPFMWARGSNIG